MCHESGVSDSPLRAAFRLQFDIRLLPTLLPTAQRLLKTQPPAPGPSAPASPITRLAQSPACMSTEILGVFLPVGNNRA